PYGLESHNTRRGGKDYADGENYALELLARTCEALTHVLSEDAHLYVFSGYSYAWTFKEILQRYFTVQDNPLIWAKNTHAICDYAKWYPSSHEYIWFCRVGMSRQLSKCVLDVVKQPVERATDHSAEKPTDLLKLLIEQSTVPGEHVLDPFCGSGS